MPLRVDKKAQIVELQTPGHGTTRLGWFHNRLHFHPRVHRLQFEGLDRVSPDHLDETVATLLDAVLLATASVRPFLFRTTVDVDDPLLTTLKQLGFLAARQVYERSLRLEDYSLEAATGSSKSPCQLVSLGAAIRMFEPARLTALFLKIYSRGSRLDPATPENITRAEQHELLVGDSSLDLDISTCAVDKSGPVGLFPIFQTDDSTLLEVGPFGVANDDLTVNQLVSLQMLDRAVSEARRRGFGRMNFEIDADDPFTVYLCAELPLTSFSTSVSLMYCPAWWQGSDRPPA